MSALSRLSRMARDFARGYAGKRGGLGTSTAFIEKPPIEPGQGIARGIKRRAESLGYGSRLQETTLERLRRGPIPPAVGPPPPPPPGPIPPLPPPLAPEPGGGRLPPPYPSGRRSATDEWIAEYFRMRAQKDAQAEEFDEIEVLGRSYDYDPEDFSRISQGSVEVSSSNVFSYYWQPESKYTGILYVTFLARAVGKGQPRQGPGPTYAYFGLTMKKYQAFRREAANSPGGAVWDHLRVRGSIFGHQVQYRLISITGNYVPRKATAKGFKTRYLKPVGRPNQVNARLPQDSTQRDRQLARRGFQRSTLPAQEYGQPARGEPDRGTPDRG